LSFRPFAIAAALVVTDLVRFALPVVFRALPLLPDDLRVAADRLDALRVADLRVVDLRAAGFRVAAFRFEAFAGFRFLAICFLWARVGLDTPADYARNS
jgi:hypothetical protein